MKVVLLQNVEKLGREGEVKEVSNGYARNYLVPRKMALYATPQVLKKTEKKREETKRRQEKELGQWRKWSIELKGKTFSVGKKAAPQGKLYGSVSSQDIASLIEKETGIHLEPKKIKLKQPLKEIGSHEISIVFNKDIQISILVEIKSEEKKSE